MSLSTFAGTALGMSTVACPPLPLPYICVTNPAYAGGARADGVTDDTNAFLAALAAAQAAGPEALVYLPEGDYKLKYCALRPYIHYLGNSWKTTRVILRHDGFNEEPHGIDLSSFTASIPEMGGDKANLRAFVAPDDVNTLANPVDSPCLGVILQGITFDCNGGTFGDMNPDVNPRYSWDTIQFYACPDIQIMDCRIKGAPSELDLSQNLRSSNLSGMMANRGFKIINNIIDEGSAYDNFALLGYYASQGTVTGNTIGGGKRSAAQIEYLSNLMRVAGNDITNNWQGTAAEFTRTNCTISVTSGVGTITAQLGTPFSSYTHVAGKKLVLIETDSAGITPAVYTITGKTSGAILTISMPGTADTSGQVVTVYQYNTGCGTVRAGSSHALYFHAARDCTITDNRCINSTAIGGAALAGFSDYDAEDLSTSGHQARPFSRNLITNNWIYGKGANTGVLLLSPATTAQVVPLLYNTLSHNTIISDTGTCIAITTDDFTKRNIGLTVTGNTLVCSDISVLPGHAPTIGAGAGGNLAVLRACDSLVWRDNNCVLAQTGQHGLTLYDCQGALIEGNLLKGPSGNALAIYLNPRPSNSAIQCENITIRNNNIDGWQMACCAVTTKINRYVFENNQIENCAQALNSFVAGATTIFMGNATPTCARVFGNWSSNATLNAKLVDYAAGTGTVTSGTSASAAISHTLAADGTVGTWQTYAAENITIIPTSTLKTAVQFRVTNFGSTTFKVSTYDAAAALANVGADFTFNWIARGVR